MAFVGLAFGTIFGFATAVLAYVVMGLPLLLCFLIYAFSGAIFTMLTVLALSARGGWDMSADYDADFDCPMPGEGCKCKRDLHADIA